MKTAAIILSLIIISHNLYSYDLVDIQITPSQCSESTRCNNVIITITNNFSDTMVTFSDFYPEGITDLVNVQPMLSYFCPNVVLFKTKDNIFVDGTIDKVFTELPGFLVLPPKIEKTVILDLSYLQSQLFKSNWNLFSYVSIAYKYDLDTLIHNNYPNLTDEYSTKLNYNNTIIVNTNSLVDKEVLPDDESKYNYDLIKKIFKFRYHSIN